MESAITEKYQAIVTLDLANSRMKDFYDIYFLSEIHSFEGPNLQKAIQETFDRRETDIPTQIPIGLTTAFFEDKAKESQWNAFVGKIADDQVPEDPLKLTKRLKKFLWPVTEGLYRNEQFKMNWTEEKKWE